MTSRAETRSRLLGTLTDAGATEGLALDTSAPSPTRGLTRGARDFIVGPVAPVATTGARRASHPGEVDEGAPSPTSPKMSCD